jgi:glycosyltransferase involved in cell wall biosynthesis
MKSVSMIFTASMHAQYYLQTKYPKYTSKIVTQYLGTLKKEDGITLAHCDNNITFLSCSRMHPIKRVPLLSSFIIDFALQLPDFFVKWIHIGDGEDRDSVESIISRIPSNLIVELKGELPNDEVHKIYKNTVIDWTLLTSISEGGCPIAIVESLCYGVPVIATSVGGIPEIVNSNNGILLTDNPTSSEFVAKIKPFIENKELYNKLKQQTTKDYYDKFDANKNHLEFIKQIEKIY